MIVFQVVTLMSTDLLRQQQQWKEALKDIRNIMNQVEEQVCCLLMILKNTFCILDIKLVVLFTGNSGGRISFYHH